MGSYSHKPSHKRIQCHYLNTNGKRNDDDNHNVVLLKWWIFALQLEHRDFNLNFLFWLQKERVENLFPIYLKLIGFETMILAQSQFICQSFDSNNWGCWFTRVVRSCSMRTTQNLSPTVMQEALPIKGSTKEKTKKSSSRQLVRLEPLLGDSCF
jgi:hypothetical protein